MRHIQVAQMPGSTVGPLSLLPRRTPSSSLTEPLAPGPRPWPLAPSPRPSLTRIPGGDLTAWRVLQALGTHQSSLRFCQTLTRGPGRRGVFPVACFPERPARSRVRGASAESRLPYGRLPGPGRGAAGRVGKQGQAEGCRVAALHALCWGTSRTSPPWQPPTRDLRPPQMVRGSGRARLHPEPS